MPGDAEDFWDEVEEYAEKTDLTLLIWKKSSFLTENYQSKHQLQETITMNARLTHVEEIELVREFQSTQTRRHLTSWFLVISPVHKIVGKFPMKSVSCSYDDRSRKVLPVYHASISLTPNLVSSSTYCYNWISAYVRRFQNTGRNVRIPVHM